MTLRDVLSSATRQHIEAAQASARLAAATATDLTHRGEAAREARKLAVARLRARRPPKAVAEAWLLAAELDPADQEAPVQAVAALIEAGEIGAADGWLRYRETLAPKRAGDLVARARVALAAGFAEAGFRALRDAVRIDVRSWTAVSEFTATLATDRRYPAALLLLGRHLRAAPSAAGDRLRAQLDRARSDWASAGARWREFVGQETASRSLAERLDRTLAIFWKEDRLAGEFGLRRLLRLHPRDHRLDQIAALTLNAQLLPDRNWRAKHLARQARHRRPDDAKIALAFLELFHGPELAAFHREAFKTIAAMAGGDIFLERHVDLDRLVGFGGDSELRYPDGARGSPRGDGAGEAMGVTRAVRAAIRAGAFDDIPDLAAPNGSAGLRLRAIRDVARAARQGDDRSGPAGRVAVCISGQMRSFFAVWPALYAQVVEPLQADVFIDTWEKTGNGRIKLDDAVLREMLGLHRSLHRLPSFADFELLFPRTMAALAGPDRVRVEELQGLPRVLAARVEAEAAFEAGFAVANLPINQAKMFYKIGGAFALLEAEEKRRGTRYDAVMRIRSDLHLTHVDLEEMKAAIGGAFDVYFLKRHSAGLDDQFAFGSRRAMASYAAMWHLMQKAGTIQYLPLQLAHTAERLLFDHLLTFGITPRIGTAVGGHIGRRVSDWRSVLPALLADMDTTAASLPQKDDLLRAVIDLAAREMGRLGTDLLDLPAGGA